MSNKASKTEAKAPVLAPEAEVKVRKDTPEDWGVSFYLDEVKGEKPHVFTMSNVPMFKVESVDTFLEAVGKEEIVALAYATLKIKYQGKVRDEGKKSATWRGKLTEQQQEVCRKLAYATLANERKEYQRTVVERRVFELPFKVKLDEDSPETWEQVQARFLAAAIDDGKSVETARALWECLSDPRKA